MPTIRRRRSFPKYRIGPPHFSVERDAVREHPLRYALADDDDQFASGAVVVDEVAPGENRNAKRREELWRHDAEPCERVLFAVFGPVAFGRESDTRAQAVGVTPGCEAADGDRFDIRQLSHASGGLFVEAEDPWITNAETGCGRGDVDDKHATSVDTSPRRLHGREHGEQDAGAREQHERTGDLHDREDAEPPIGGRCDSNLPLARPRPADACGDGRRGT